MWVCKRLDMPWSLLSFGLRRCFGSVDPTAEARHLEQLWAPDGAGLVVLSVRSGFDLLLASLELPRGSEVLFSAITIKDMPRIVARHGLVPVPVDLDADSLALDLESVRRAITPATRAIVVAHLFGGRMDLDPLIQLAREHGLMVIEDCAQAFAGRSFTGHADADVSMFSFGPIKTSTALGGGLLRVRDPELLARMRACQSRYPRQSQRAYFRRLLGYSALKLLSSRPLYGPLLRLHKLLGRVDDRGTKNSVLKNFSGGDLIPQIRRRPCAALVSVLTRSVLRFDPEALARRSTHGERLRALLGGRIQCPGIATYPHSFWVFPITADDPERTIARLRRAGFDAAQGDSMCAVPSPADRPELFPVRASSIAEQLVYVPCYPELPEAELLRLAELLRSDSALSPAAPAPWQDGSRNGEPSADQHVPVATVGTPVQSEARFSNFMMASSGRSTSRKSAGTTRRRSRQ